MIHKFTLFLCPVSQDHLNSNGKLKIIKSEQKNISNRKHDKLLKLFARIKETGEWNLHVECIALTHEQEAIFYIKDRDGHLYYSKFENFYFAKNPSIGIDDNVMGIIKIIESVK